MCECSLLVENDSLNPIEISSEPNRLVYSKNGMEFELLKGIVMPGVVDYAAAHEIFDSHGVKHGYMFVIGEKQ